MPAHPAAKRPRLAAPGHADENVKRSRSAFKWGAVLTPGSYPPLKDTNPSEPAASTSATTLEALSTRTPSPTKFPPSASCPDEDSDDAHDALGRGRRIFRKQDLVRLVRTSFDYRIVPTTDRADDRKDLRRWIPGKYLKDGALAPEGLFIANSLTCVRLNRRVAKRNRSEGVVVVPRGHDDLKESGDKDMWCLICPKTTEDMDGLQQEFNPRIGKTDRHVWKPIHRQSLAAALDIPVENLPPEQRYQCPFYGHPRCEHKWSGRTDPVVRHINRVCKANPHSVDNVEKYGLLPFPDDERVFVDDSMWRPTEPREEASDQSRDGDEEGDSEVESEDEVLPTSPSSARPRLADTQEPRQNTATPVATTPPQPPPASRVAKPEAEVRQPPSRPTRQPPPTSTMPQAGPSTAAGSHPPPPFTAPRPAPAPTVAPTYRAKAGPHDELAFVSQFFDFDAYEADHLAWCAQHEAGRRAPGESSPLKRKGE